jgi:hypothetical protein
MIVHEEGKYTDMGDCELLKLVLNDLLQLTFEEMMLFRDSWKNELPFQLADAMIDAAKRDRDAREIFNLVRSFKLKRINKLPFNTLQMITFLARDNHDDYKHLSTVCLPNEVMILVYHMYLRMVVADHEKHARTRVSSIELEIYEPNCRIEYYEKNDILSQCIVIWAKYYPSKDMPFTSVALIKPVKFKYKIDEPPVVVIYNEMGEREELKEII